MNKAEMADRLATRTGLNKVGARDAVDSMFTVIGEDLANGEEVRIAGFGTFAARTRPTRTGRNPRTGGAISISASKSPSFKAGKAIGDAVNGGRRSLPWAGCRSRPMTPRIHAIWKPADCYTMTGALDAAGLLPGKTQRGHWVAGWAAAGLDTRLHMRQEGRGGAWN